MTANTYPGNPSLAPEVKERVLSTFSQTLSLFDEGQLDEVVAGCDLILEMDDRFDPARKLRQKAKDPSAPIDLSSIYSLRDKPPATEQAAPPADNEALVLEAVEALQAGNYEAAIGICNTILSADPGHEEAQRIGQQANERLESDPFVRQFIQEAGAAIDRGDIAAARSSIEKAKSLDPLHPAIDGIIQKVDAAEETTAAPSGGGFDFGGDHAPFASAFAGGDGASDESDSPAFVTPEQPSAPAPETASFDFASAAEDQPADVSVEPPAEVPSEQPEEPDTSSSEATNFGFVLEEAPPSETTEASDVAATVAPEPEIGEGRTFDFSTGDIEVSEGDQQKIDNYLRDGDDLFEAGEYQGAIDSWSKIFLIDVTNEQASERIERAKERKREGDQKLDDLVTTGIAAYDRADYQTARETFEEVLAQDPDNFRAGEYLEKLDDHSAATAAGPAGGFVPPPPPPSSTGSDETLYDGDLYDDGLSATPPPTPAVQGRAGKTAAPPRSSSAAKSSKGLIIAVVAVVALAVGGWLGWSMLTGNEPQQTDSAITQGKINRAQVLAEGGSYSQAIALLSSVEPGDPMREQALQLIAQYRQQQAETSGTVGGRPMNEVRDELLIRARESFAEEDFIAAKSAFEEAAKLKALEGTDREMYEAASNQVSKLDTATSLFAQGSYSDAIEELSAVLETEPDNVNAREMLNNARFNLGVNALKSRETERAVEQFGLVLEQNPDDAMARRSLEIAQLYEDRPKDLMYEIFIKYLPLR